MEHSPYSFDGPSSAETSSETAVDKKKKSRETTLKLGDMAAGEHLTLWQRHEAKSDKQPARAAESSLNIFSERPAEPAESQAENAKPEASTETKDDREREAATGIVTARSYEVAEEQAGLDTGSSEAAEAATGAAFLGAAREELKNNQQTAEESLERAAESTDTAVDEVIESSKDEPSPRAEEPEVSETVSRQPETEDDSDTPEQPPVAAAGGGGSTPPPPRPPQPPTPPTPAAAPGPGGTPVNPNTYAAANLAPAPANVAGIHAYYRRQRFGDFMLGGFVGYLWGRRRGRKKAEKRLRPEIAALGKENTGLKRSIAEKEAALRAATRQRIETTPPAEKQSVIAKVQTLPERVKEVVRIPAQPVPERVVERTQPSILVEKPVEIRLAPGAVETIPFHKRAEELSHNELIAAAEKVIIDRIPLREMYEAQRFDEKGLRRIMDAFLRGGDVREALRVELVRKETSYERDPNLRAMGAGALAGGGMAAGAAAVQAAQASPALEAPAPLQTQPATPHPEPDPATLAALKRRQLVAASGGVALIVLIGIILILVLSR